MRSLIIIIFVFILRLPAIATTFYVSPQGDDSYSGSIFQNTESNNYHLIPGCLAVDKGTTVNAPPTDIEGNSRPQGLGIDIGAYEYTIVSTVEKTDRISEGFILSPNPVNDYLEITSDFALSRIEIVDIGGKIIKVIDCDNQYSLVITSGDLNKGIYLVRGYSGNRIFQVKIIKL